MHRIAAALAAGTAGTVALNSVTYLDMALRGRPASPVPAEAVGRMAGDAGISLGEDDERASARKEGLGALMGLLTGVAGGAAFGLVRPLARGVPTPVAGVLAGLSIMAATDGTSAALGATDPRGWAPADWLADIVPHLAYGAGVAVTFDALDR